MSKVEEEEEEEEEQGGARDEKEGDEDADEKGDFGDDADDDVVVAAAAVAAVTTNEATGDGDGVEEREEDVGECCDALAASSLVHDPVLGVFNTSLTTIQLPVVTLSPE